MPRTELRYRWRFYDEARGKHFVTRYHATEDQIRPRHADAVAVPGTEHLLELPDDLFANSAARIGASWKPPG